MRVLATITTRLEVHDADPIPEDEIRATWKQPSGKLDDIREHGKKYDVMIAAIRDFRLSGGSI